MTPAPRKVRRILMTTDTVGGVWTYAMELVRFLERHGIGVVLATMGGKPSCAQRQEVNAVGNVELYESEFKLEWMDDPWNDVAAAGKWLLVLEKRCAPDLVHLNGYSHAALSWRSPVVVVAHSCVYSWYAAVKAREPSKRWEPYGRCVTEGLRCADLVVAPSGAMLSSLREHYGDCFSSSQVIYNGRPSEKFKSSRKEPFLLAAGRLWDEAKNIALLREVARRVEWPLCVAGEKTHPEGGDAFLEPLKGLGALPPEAMAAWFERASIFLSPARYEPFGLAVLEAGLAGCALILSDIPTFREIWQDAACFVAPGEGEEWATLVKRMIGDEAFRVESARKARQRALAFSSDRMGRAYLEAYETIIRKRIRNENCSILSISSLGLESR